ncbi:MAG: alanyl-tRNA editing protein AlaXM [Candidatus Nanoarchaeia archaeon]|nr:alanyl-tRNA editing protein AlaXM [Candidatus Haiyanarchaeum thermophilum]MCW1303444.1 alanyl-tRNA editing protein AlaXM [Candidatus Haiyanarchaeum thermophilum]MCW1306854.1 alanyl-tRNA editing protein AlaXM [Candidatus Haiyanarchaeum thermophilum]MCW1308274.1 alanyl-tRNA editing protein AlaXM [Candidatus Haiyanarchaeum thermophilum]MCW1308624.1 alanyl-tRNA editing protein AlaXM [Candidatus Haiyanarchaeum thermophilum]
MDQALYLMDSYMKEFDAKIIKVNQNEVVLDKTLFYPEGGGQPHDTGKFIRSGEEFKVINVRKSGGDIIHVVDRVGLNVGDVVHGIIDWERRYKLMRMHTASHIISAVIHQQCGALITGNQLGLEESRIDFNLEYFDRNVIEACVEKANEIIAQGLQVKSYFLPREEALKIPSISKLASQRLPSTELLRIVEIPGVDIQADGGTHVKNTSEIGRIVVKKLENKGKNNRRIYFSLQK